MSEARSTSHFASYPRSAREPSTAPSARRGGWVGLSPRHHGQNSTSPGEPAGAVRSPRTFSITTRQGRRALTARATCSHSPERVWAFSPARRPATETSLAGEARRQDAHPGDGGPVDGRDVAQVGDAGPVPGQDARGVRIDLRVPGQRAAESRLHTQVKAAVPRAERTDQRRLRQRGAHVTGPVWAGPEELPAARRRERERERLLRPWIGCGRPEYELPRARAAPPRRAGNRL